MSDWYDIHGNALADVGEWSSRGPDWERAHRSTKVNETTSVSTVWLGLDHSYDGGPPLIFETMVFGGNLDQDCQRYSTMEQAHADHDRIVAKVKAEAAAFADLAADEKVRDCLRVIQDTLNAHRAAFDLGEYGDLYSALLKAAAL